MLDAFVRLWAGVLSATAPLKLLLAAAFLSLAVVAVCLLGCCCSFGWSAWRRFMDCHRGGTSGGTSK